MTLPIRSAVQNDYADLVRLWPELDDPNPPPSQPRWEKEMMPTSMVAVAVDDDEKASVVVGYVWWTVTGPEGQVKYIVVDAKYRRRGVASALLRAVAHKLKYERNCRRWRLFVRPENQPAVALYQKFGLERRFGDAEVHLTWNCVSRLPDGPDAVECRPVLSPEDEAGLETAFDLSPGVFCEARELGGRIPLQLHSGDAKSELLGCCIFDPTFPGAYPFCVVRPLFAKCLLKEMKKSRDKARDDFFLLVEKQEALTEALVAAGAKVEIHMDCFSGQL